MIVVLISLLIVLVAAVSSNLDAVHFYCLGLFW